MVDPEKAISTQSPDPDLTLLQSPELNQALPMYGNPITTAASTDSRSVASASEKTSIKSDSEAECSSQPDSSGDDDYDDDDDDDDMVLKKAGVKLQLGDLQGQEKAPLTLLTEFVSCCVSDRYKAAKILCTAILKLEPSNQTARQFLPVLEERLELDRELPTESSSEDEEGSEDTPTSSDSSDETSDEPLEAKKTTPTLSSPQAKPSTHSKQCRI